MNEGDWVEGELQWWWKCAFPTRERLWVSVLQEQIIQVTGPHPDPWREATPEILEGLLMAHTAMRLDDVDVSQRLRQEAAEKIIRAVERVRG